jgi:hypothetical protein
MWSGGGSGSLLRLTALAYNGDMTMRFMPDRLRRWHAPRLSLSPTLVAVGALLALLSVPAAQAQEPEPARIAPQAEPAAPLKQQPTPVVVRDPDMGLEFASPKKPSGWKYQRKKAGSYFFAHDGGRGAFCVLTVEMKRSASDLNLTHEQMTQILRETIEESEEFKEVKVEPAKPFKTKAGIEGTRMEFAAKLEGMPMRGVLFGFTKEGRVAVFTGLTPTTSARRYLSGLDDSARSLAVLSEKDKAK